jgi:hypothetical protein
MCAGPNVQTFKVSGIKHSKAAIYYLQRSALRLRKVAALMPLLPEPR